MFDSMFAMWVPAPTTRPGIVPMELWQLGRASAVYGFGFLVLFALMGPAHFWWGTRRSRKERALFHSEATETTEQKELV